MPQKHNPVDAISALASARLAIGEVPVILSAMAQEHERAAGGWQAEWTALPRLFCSTASAVARVGDALSGLQIDPARMQTNLALTRGLIMAESLTMSLAQYIGKPEAQRIVQSACDQALQSGLPLRQIAMQDAHISSYLSSEALDHALDPSNYLGSTNTFIDRALASYHSLHLTP
jgi:3-carboxy-cis,cis-muconate cycloisomerase